MTITTAKVAGVKQVIACKPPNNGSLTNATIAAAHFAGADEIHILSGTQAIAGMAVSTETIAKVDFLAGPGNAFVAEAKRLLFGKVGVNVFVGPTDILKTQTYQEVVDEKVSGEMDRLCGRLSRAENFEGHARSGDLRAHKYLGDKYKWLKEARAQAA